MRRLMFLAAFVGGTTLIGCTAADTATTGQSIACYDTANGILCGATDRPPTAVARDVDGDGSLDRFVCGDTESASDSASDSVDGDSTGDDPGDDGGDEPEDETGALSDSDDADSDSASNDDCGGGDEVSDSPSNSDSTVDSADSAGDDSVSDGDDDGNADGADCDCLPPDPVPV